MSDKLLPPVGGADHPLFKKVKRTPLLTHELPVNVETFFLDYWAKGDFWEKFGKGMGWTDIVVSDWSKLDGCLERKVYCCSDLIADHL
jgi:hypothetical protein